MAAQHTLIYFSGVADDFGVGGKQLKLDHGQDVLTDMEQLHIKSEDTKVVAGFGGTLKDKQGAVRLASDFIARNHDSRGKLVIYGYSAGGINSLDLCRFLHHVGQQTHLLVTVDVSGRGEAVNRHVPPNVLRTRNYFQTDDFFSGSQAIGGPALGKSVDNINCDDFPFENIIISRKTRHGQMQDLTRHKVRQDMVIELNKS